MEDLFGAIRTQKRRGVILRDLPTIPDTGWRAPTEPPNLSAAVGLGIDCETWDPDLIDAGPGWARGRGHIVGVSLAAIDRQGNRGKWYFPIRHSVEPQDNLDPARVMPWIAEQVANPYTYKAGANFLYDMGWLAWEGCPVTGPFHDIQFGEAIIDNNAKVSLETLARKYLGIGKTTALLEQWILDAYKPPKTFWRKDIHRAPPRLVGPYAEDDADLPLRILPYQWQQIQEQDLGRVYDMENALLPMLVGMRMSGVRVDVERAMIIRSELVDLIAAEYDAIYRDYGFRLDSTDSRQVAKLFDKERIKYPTTKPSERSPEGSPSIQKPWLALLEHPLGDRINDLREMEKMVGTFIDSYIIEKNVNGRLYPQFHPLRGEVNGTLLGRFSSSDPNLQNIPSRTDLGKRIRTCFVPNLGDIAWRKHDFSQLHYRILASLAVDSGDGSANALRQSYIDDPHLDYHMKVYRAAAPLLGWNTDYTLDEKGEFNKEIKKNRRPIKNVNFGLIYGQGETSLAYKAGFTKENAGTFFAAYHQGAPYVKPTMASIAFEAERDQYVTTLLGRRIRFAQWEPRDNRKDSKGNTKPALPYDMALAEYGSMIRLAYLYRAVNYKIQGSEPDIMKSAMLALWNSGVFNYIGLPQITVHDELDWSMRDRSPQTLEAFEYVRYTMENTTRLSVPLIVDASEGPNWGYAE